MTDQQPINNPNRRVFVGIIVLLVIGNAIFFAWFFSNQDTNNRIAGFMNEGNAAYDARQYDDAITAYTRALNIAGDDERIYYNRALAYLANEQLTEAEADLRQAVDINADYPYAYRVLGVVQCEQGNTEAGRESIQRYLQLMGTDAAASEVVGDCPASPPTDPNDGAN